MNTTTIVTVVCIFSTLLMGCYSSVFVVPDDAENVKMNSRYIDYVVTKDGTKYELEKPPVVANDTLMGEATVTGIAQVNQEETSIPLSDLALVHKSNSAKTEYVVTKAGAKYTYDEPPATVNGAVVGKGKFAGFTPMREQVSIPLSDIRSVEASKLEVGPTIAYVGLGCVVVAGAVVLVVMSTMSLY